MVNISNFSSQQLLIKGIQVSSKFEIEIRNDLLEDCDVYVFPLKNFSKSTFHVIEHTFGFEAYKLCESSFQEKNYEKNFNNTTEPLIIKFLKSSKLIKLIFINLDSKELSPLHVIPELEFVDNGSQVAFQSGRSTGESLSCSSEHSLCLYFDNNVVAISEFKLFIQGFLLGISPDNRYKTNTDKVENYLTELVISFISEKLNKNDIEKLFDESFICAQGTQLTRELVNTPPNHCNPESLANVSVKLASALGLRYKILDEQRCRELNMNAYLSVNQGSSFECQFIHLIYKPQTSYISTRIAFIGKGICMDTGGYNLKVAGGIETMKIDMGGAAAVLGAAYIIGSLKPSFVEVHFIIPAAENMISSKASRPGDIVIASNGKYIEIGNTDAEGRLTLADALVYAEKHVKVDQIIECATLTGAIKIGLGPDVAAVYCNSTELLKCITSNASITGTMLWPMPFYKPYKKMNESKIADIRNVGNTRYGGSIQAALFLSEFVDKVPFSHIDLAGPVVNDSTCLATGYGALLLASIALNITPCQL